MVQQTQKDERAIVLFILSQLRFTLAQAKGYISSVSAERGDGGKAIADEIEERMSEVEALQERFRRK